MDSEGSAVGAALNDRLDQRIQPPFEAGRKWRRKNILIAIPRIDNTIDI